MNIPATIFNIDKAITQKIILPGTSSEVPVHIKREDLIHPAISGNKYRKLKYNIEEAKLQNHHTLLTFGGAYSNHIYAVAECGRLFGFNTIGIIRGEEHLPHNPTLKFAAESGMKISYLDRKSYRMKENEDFIKELSEQFGNFYLLPEGGTNNLAVKGCVEIVHDTDAEFDYLCCPCGTGGTAAGLIAGLKGEKNVLGFSVLKGAGFLNKKVENLVSSFTGKLYSNWSIQHDYHFGGYAKINYELLTFMNEFNKLNGITLDPVYTGKMMFGIADLINKGVFNKGTKILSIHTGGLQGIEGMKKKIGLILERNKVTG